jgi:hypothetical protein
MKFAYFAAVSVVVIAQAASAQTVIANQAVTLKAVTISRGGTTVSVTLTDGMVWSFDAPRNISSDGATVAGVAVAPNALKKGMKCVLNGIATPSRNIITSLAC